MNFLPPELLLEIFKYLNANDLLNISTISRNFNQIISHSELATKLTLNFRKLNENSTENALSRKYQKLKIGYYKVNIHAAILCEIGDNFVQLEFSFCRLKLDLIRKILLTCRNVKILKFLKAQLTDEPNEIKLPLPALIDVELSLLCSDVRIFRFLLGCLMKSVVIDHKYKHATGELSELTQFLRNQDRLQELDLSDFHYTNLFGDQQLDFVRFRLKTLRLRNVNLAKTIHFKTFMDNNLRESLETFEINKLENCNISIQIASLRCLQTLKIDSISVLEQIEELPHLKNLVFFGLLPLKLNQILHKFPALKFIEMHYSRLFYDEEEFTNAYGRINFPFEFSQLKIIDSTIAKLKTKSIKNLALKNVKICENFFKENQQIEEFSVENCFFDLREIPKNFGYLKKLELIDVEVSQEVFDLMEKNCRNLRVLRLKIVRGNFELGKLKKNRKIDIFVS